VPLAYNIIYLTVCNNVNNTKINDKRTRESVVTPLLQQILKPVAFIHECKFQNGKVYLLLYANYSRVALLFYFKTKMLE
jgi:hypothetical protein